MTSIRFKSNASIAIAFLVLTSCSVVPEYEQPNIVFILVDDLGWNDLGYTGSTFHESPNIDLMSSESIQFTRAYASGSVCSPTRASIFSGKHPARLQITDWIPGQRPNNRVLIGPPIENELPLEENTLAEVLKSNGYNTFFAGKWHLGGDGFFPENQGFETNLGGHEKGSPPGGYYTPYKNPKLSDGPDGEYLTDRLTDESISFIESQSEKQDPFFLFLSFYTVHTPIQPNEEFIEKFENKFNSLGFDSIPSTPEGLGTTTLEQMNPAYASMIYSLDQNIGRLVNRLKSLGLYENTLIVFTSDNGGLSTLESRYNRLAPTSTRPLRGGKGWLYEGGVRIPLLIKPPGHDGSTKKINTPVVSHDLFPTVLSIANIPLPPRVDGIDLSPVIYQTGELERSELFWHYPHYHGSGWQPGASILKEDWKLIEFYESKKVELYNLKHDMAEKMDLSSQNPEKVKELKMQLHELQQSMNAKFPTINSEFSNTPNQ